MRQLAPEFWQLSGFPPNAINVYLIGDVLIDAATRWAGRRILGQLGDRKLSMVALTHVHPDHQGVAKKICDRFQIPLACHVEDQPTMEGVRPMQPNHPLIWFSSWVWSGPVHPVSKPLKEGDEVAGFKVIHTPGHTPGHVTFFREEDRVAIVGDVLNGMSLLTTLPGLHEPPRVFCTDPAQNRKSIFKVAELEPKVLCFGHGPPLTDMRVFERFLKKLEGRGG